MTRRTRNLLIAGTVIAAGLTTGGAVPAADSGETPRERVDYVVEEGDRGRHTGS
ncbi:hypothetical protein ACIQNG_38810 [Streptomyces sp. NPDC091377]|uniref:hypothetical protein n=1 Tax=unclassified Streptomyces TaxID=2593676 RepID=UPI00382BFFBE